MKGLGDNIYQRAFIKNLVKTNDVYLATPWPEIYEDLPVKFLAMQTPLRTQAKNLAKQDREYFIRPDAGAINPSYNGIGLKRVNIVQNMASKFGIQPTDFDLPHFDCPIDLKSIKKPICVVRPVTLRTEWLASARNPEPAYIFDVINRIKSHYFVVSVADILPPQEIALNPLPHADLTFHAGELNVKQLLGLIQAAKLVVGGVGWIVPACIATKTPLFCILGGNGMFNAPHKITDECMDLSRITFATPDKFCMCDRMQHKCNKTISNLSEQLNVFLGNNQ
jgi:hypothetical protein